MRVLPEPQPAPAGCLWTILLAVLAWAVLVSLLVLALGMVAG